MKVTSKMAVSLATSPQHPQKGETMITNGTTSKLN